MPFRFLFLSRKAIVKKEGFIALNVQQASATEERRVYGICAPFSHANTAHNSDASTKLIFGINEG